MPGYLRGFVELEFADRWEFVCRVDPFTGSQGVFKYVFLGHGYAMLLDPVVHTEGWPDDMAAATKLAMMGRTDGALERLSNEDLEAQFETFRDRVATSPPPRYVSLEALLAFDWDSGITDEARAEMAEMEPGVDPHAAQAKSLRLFELTDSDGTDYDDWAPENDGGWRSRVRDEEDALLRGETVELDGRTASLRPRSRRELLPDNWFTLLDMLSGDYRNVRFIFYWHH